MRRVLMAVHVVFGLCCNVALGLTSENTAVALRAALLAGLYYAMALAWMFQNSLLPSVASSARRPTVSLMSAGLSNAGAGFFLLLQCTHCLLASLVFIRLPDISLNACA